VKILTIKGLQTERGVEIIFRGSRYVIEYPDGIWRDYPQKARGLLLDNLVYAETMHLPLTHKTREIVFDTSPPYFQTHFFQNLVMDLPSCADVDGTSTAELLKAFMNIRATFKDQDMKFPSYVEETREDSSIVSISFGKDSLLTWAVARELGLNPQLCYVVEPLLTYEEKHKLVLAEAFHKEFGVKLIKIRHSAGKLRDGIMLGLGKTEIGWGLQSTEYALMILPVAHRYGARYIMMGNEQSCSEYYHDREGYISYPAYDQSHVWSKQIDSMIRQMTGGGVRYMSVIEPLNDIAVIYVLYKRYPEVAKYHMSCFVETHAGRDHRWCLDCSVCSKMYLLIVACGFDPQAVGLTRNMLTKECRNYYSLFGGSSVNTYALTGRGRDEQLFGFYLAWKKGDRSDLVQEFEKRFLDEAKDREDELYKTFFGLHTSITMPQHINEAAMSVYKEVLSDVP
jgi:hypothetical protein